MFKKSIAVLLCCCVIPTFVGCSALAGVTGGTPSVGSGGGATAQDIDNFFQQATDADVRVKKAAYRLTMAVASKEKAEELKAKRDAINKIKDPKEKEAKLSQFHADNAAILEKTDFDAVAKRAEQAQDVNKNKAVKASLFNLCLGILTDGLLLKTAQKLVSGVPDLSVANRLGTVRESIVKIGAQIKSLKDVVGRSSALMKVVKLDKLPTSAAEPPMEVDGEI